MLLQKYCSSISAVYAAAAGRPCGCRRCNQDSATAAACCSCTTTADCLLAAVDFVNKTGVLCVYVCVHNY